MTMRAEAPEFLMPPPGLGALSGVEAANTLKDWQSPCPSGWHSGCSTALPSPVFGPDSPCFMGSLSPWAEAFGPPGVFGIEEASLMMLPEASAELPPHEWETTKMEFELSGMEDFTSSVASILAAFTSTPAIDGGSSTSAGASDEDLSCPSTPKEPKEFSPVGPPPGLELEGADAAETQHEGDEGLPLTMETVAAEAQVPEEAVPAKKRGWSLTSSVEASPMEVASETSVMLQNFPRKCTRDLLAKRLSEAGFCGDYDLLYVTADLKQRNSGSGTALVNFRSQEACKRFMSAFHKAGVADAFPGFVGKKPIEVVLAPVQGLSANVAKLEKSGVLMSMLAERPGWQPARYNEAGELEAEVGA